MLPPPRSARFGVGGGPNDGVAALDPPVVSVVVLTRDRPHLLRRCLASLASQDCDRTIEIIVADDGSDMATTTAVREAQATDPRIRHVRHTHRGIPATRNLGVATARGGFVSIVADDYVLAPGYLSRALDYLEARPDASVVRFDQQPVARHLGARISHCFYADSITRRLAAEGVGTDDARGGAATTTLEAAGAAVFRREALDDAGPWDESLARTEDTEHTARLRALGHEVHILVADLVRVHYGTIPIDTLRKCFLTGRYRTHLPPAAVHRPPRPDRFRALGRAVLRARDGSAGVAEFALFLPFMVLFEATILLGDLYERMWGRRTRRHPGRSRGPDAVTPRARDCAAVESVVSANRSRR